MSDRWALDLWQKVPKLYDKYTYSRTIIISISIYPPIYP